MKTVKDAFTDASRRKRTSFLAEFWYFLRDNKKWWLIPILVILAVLALLCFFAGTGAAPFIYTLY